MSQAFAAGAPVSTPVNPFSSDPVANCFSAAIPVTDIEVSLGFFSFSVPGTYTVNVGCCNWQCWGWIGRSAPSPELEQIVQEAGYSVEQVQSVTFTIVNDYVTAYHEEDGQGTIQTTGTIKFMKGRYTESQENGLGLKYKILN